MSETDLKRLEGKIEGLSKQISKLQKAVIGVTSVREKRLEERREILWHYRSLLLGLILGIFGNMFVSYLMKVLDFLQISSEWWLLATVVAFGGFLYLIRLFMRTLKKLSREPPSSRH